MSDLVPETDPSESLEARAAHERYRLGRRASHRRYSWVCRSLAAAAGLATLLPWATRLQVVPDPRHAGRYVAVPTHVLGLATLPAGPLVAVFAVGLVYLSVRLKSGSLPPAWATLLAGLGALGVAVTEVVQLLLGRRDWVDRLTVTVNVGPTARAVGPGVWVSGVALATLCLTVVVYLWFLRSSRLPSAPPER